MIHYNRNVFVSTYTPFTIYSLCITLLWTGIFILVFSILRNKKIVLKHCPANILFILLIVCITRILLPIEMPFTQAIHCDKILPPIRDFFTMPVIKSPYMAITLGEIIIFLWLFPAILIIQKRLKEYIRFKHIISIMPASGNKYLYNLCNKADIYNDMPEVKIIVCNFIKSPSITGLLHPVILLPDIQFSGGGLFGIFMHEIAHYRFKHNFIKLIMEFICAVFWWNPLFKKLYSELSHTMELQADREVCLNLRNSQKKEYLQAIAKVAAANIKTPNIIPSCSSSILDNNDNKKLIQRFKMITENRHKSCKKKHLIFIPLIIAAFLLSYSIVFQPYNEPPNKDMKEGMAVIHIDKNTLPVSGFYIIKVDNGYDLYGPDGFLSGITPGNLPYLKGIKVYQDREEAKKEVKPGS